MNIKIDYLSFTIPCAALPDAMSDEVQDYVLRRLYIAGLQTVWDEMSKHKWTVYKAHGFYAWRVMDEVTKMSVSWGSVNPHIFVECPGETCDWMRNLQVLDTVIERTQERVSRIDVAGDWETSLEPATLTESSANKRIKSRSVVQSSSGVTAYLGSRTSPSFMRVYRFAEPHPRAALLRVEIELKSVSARAGVDVYLARGLEALFDTAAFPYQLTNAVWLAQERAAGVTLAGKRDRTGSGKVRWLLTAVLPALVKLQSTGQFDVVSWLKNDVLPRLENDQNSTPTP